MLRWRRVAFIAVICLLLLGWLEGPLFVVGLLSPWVHPLPERRLRVSISPSTTGTSIHIWSLSAILVGGSLVALLHRPESKPVVANS